MELAQRAARLDRRARRRAPRRAAWYASSASAWRPQRYRREHQPPVQPLAQRLLGDERLELADDLGVAPGGEVGVDAAARRATSRSSSSRASVPWANGS